MITNGITWTKEDIELVEKFIDIRNRGYYVSGEQLTSAYNRILHKNVNPTNCSSCLRQRVNELAEALERFKRLSEASKPDEPITTPEEENKAVVDQKNEDMKARMEKVRAARGKNKQ